MPNLNRSTSVSASHMAGALLAAVLAASLMAVGPAAAREVGSRLGISAATSTTTVPVQFRLASTSGILINGLKTMTFKLYSVASGGSALWTETWTAGNAVQVTDGVASVLLGSHTSLPQTLIATNGTLYLGITVDAEAEMQPRVQLGSAPIAMTVPDGSIGAVKIADGAVSLAKLAPAVQDVMGSSLNQNALINGNMDIWQRGTSILSPTNKLNAYAADRWFVVRSAYTAGLVASQQDGSGVPGSRFAQRVQRPAGNAALAPIYLIQTIETPNTVLMRGRKWTLSFWARKGADYSATSSALVYGVNERTAVDESAEANTGITEPATANLTTSWQKYTMTMSSAVQASTNTIKVVFVTNPQGTAGTNDWFEITQVQLNAGETATPFAAVPFGVELLRCKRYYQKSYEYAVTPGAYALLGGSHGHAIEGNTVALFVRFESAMRTSSPALTFYSPGGGVNRMTDFYTGVDTSAITDFEASSSGIRSLTVGGVTSGRIYDVAWTADAEP